MDLRKLEQFVAVAEELHFGRAALRLKMAQPPLSQAIRRLELQLGVDLFRRTRRTVTLTEAGQHLLKEAPQLLARADALENTMHAVACGEAGELRIGYNAPAIHAFLAHGLHHFREAYPAVDLKLSELASDQQVRQLKQRRLHVGFLRLFGEEIDTLVAEPVFRESYVLVLPRKHRLARRKSIGFEDLREEPMVRFPHEGAPSYQDWMLQHLRDAGLDPQVAVESTSSYANIALVAAGIGVAFAAQSMAKLKYPGSIVRPLADPLPDILTHMVWQKDGGPPALEPFVAFIRDHLNVGQAQTDTSNSNS